MFEGLATPEYLQQLDAAFLLLLACLLAPGLIMIFGGLRRYFKGRFITASLQSLSGVVLVLAGLLLLSIASNLYTYHRLTNEQQIINVSFEQLGPQRYRATLIASDSGRYDSFILTGDEWQLDARVIKWHPYANLFGLDTYYRLERLSGRYQNLDDELNKERSIYALNQRDNIDYWQLFHDYQKYLPWVDAYYGNATYLPMSDNARYVVSVSQTGLLARANNETTKEKLREW